MGFVDDDLVEFDGRVHPPDVGVIPEKTKGKKNPVNQQLTSRFVVACLCSCSAHGLMLSMSLNPSGVEQPECVALYCDVFSLVQVI